MTGAAVGARVIEARVNYTIDTGVKPRFHANDHELDTVRRDPRTVSITDARTLSEPPTLEREGGALFTMPTGVTDFRNDDEVAAVYPGETEQFIKNLTGADAVVATGPATLRFSERSTEAGSRNNSDAARLVHSDSSESASLDFVRQNNPRPESRIARAAQHNIWRTFSGPPQDVPLALCDARSVDDDDIVLAEAAFDVDGEIVWSFEALLFRYNPAHRWFFYSEMTPDEVLVFKRHDTDHSVPYRMPHSAFTDASVPDGVPPRASIEMRTIAYWFE